MVEIKYKNGTLYLILYKSHFYLTDNELKDIVEGSSNEENFIESLIDTLYDYLQEDSPMILEKIDWNKFEEKIKQWEIYKNLK